ncbi:F-box associated domain type 3 [Arabidopsis suecica]|uniref:F-box associated domain type 3 n=1 Tax=Arabidopsis suecica TaxID=45249 RepID=A0A8T2BBM2_ARASU|nr:F-box associated domain type 3 [Arabidopsis suecica]
MVIKRIELCIEITKIAMEFLVVVADAVTIFLRQSSPPPPALLHHGLYSYSLPPPLIVLLPITSSAFFPKFVIFMASLLWLKSASTSKNLSLIIKLLFQASVYLIWRERNLRIHSNNFRNPHQIIKEIQLLVRARLDPLSRLQSSGPLGSSLLVTWQSSPPSPALLRRGLYSYSASPYHPSSLTEEEDNYEIFFFMGHNPVKDQLKLLCTFTTMSNDMQKIESELWVFVLEAGSSWKRVAKEFPPHLPHPFELNMNGVLYYLAWTDMHTCVLVSFDFRSEEFNMIQVPRKAGDKILPRLKKWLTQIDYGGKVAVFDMTYLKVRGTVDLWVVQDWRNKEWLRKTLVLQPSQLHPIFDNHRLLAKGTLKGKVILVPRYLVSPFYFLCYDLQLNDLKKVEIKGIPDRWFSKYNTDIYCDIEFMNPSESIEYLET